jgi:hypothetical protein
MNRRISVIVSAGRGGSDAKADGKGCKRMREERGKEIKVGRGITACVNEQGTEIV